MAIESKERLFPVLGEPARCFHAGHLPDRRQVLVGWGASGTVIVAFFDAGGNLLEVVRRPDYTFEVDDDEFEEYLKQEFGFTPGLIRIKEFHIAGEDFAVYPLPKLFQAFMMNPR